MSTQRHIIKRQVIELKVQGAASTARTQPLQDEISRIHRQRLIPLIDKSLTEMSDPDKLYRIESLELDIGAIDPQHLEEDLVEKVRNALRRELASQIGIQKRGTGATRQSPRTNSHLELFEFFARTGNLPWWAEASNPQLLAENVKYLLRDSPQALRPLVQELVRKPFARQRMVNQYTDEQLLELIGLLVPAYKLSSISTYQALIRILQKTKAASGRQTFQLRRILWNNLLLVASLGGQEYTSLQDFYQAALKRVAIELGIISKTFIVEMQQVLTDDKSILETATQTIADQILQLLKPEKKEDDLSWDESTGLRQLPSIETNNKTAVDASTQAITPQKLFSTESNDHAVVPTLTGKSADQAEARIDSRFSEADEVYVTNAGLVILCPFLENFFAHVNLLEAKQFKDRAAEHRAVGLLQVLAMQESISPEYLLPLNKILCGLEVEEVFDFGAPLLDSEAEECERLLEAVIAQAPILHDMSTTGFRGSFLLRAGMLSIRDGQWLLRVEKETYDVVLERFPWSWQWIKLPWMDAPLRVEW